MSYLFNKNELKKETHIARSVFLIKPLSEHIAVGPNQCHANCCGSYINIILFLFTVSADTELKLSTLDVPIVGNVNILRYLSYVYPSVIPYNSDDHHVDYLLDLCHMLERTSDKNKEVVVTKLFSSHKNWIYQNEFSIVDLAAYNVIKQWKNVPKYVPKAWFDKCDKLLL